MDKNEFTFQKRKTVNMGKKVVGVIVQFFCDALIWDRCA